jgi:hypothetical protein
MALRDDVRRRRHCRRGDRLLDRQTGGRRQALVLVRARDDRGRAGHVASAGAEGDPSVSITPAIAVRLVTIGLIVGASSGFFGTTSAGKLLDFRLRNVVHAPICLYRLAQGQGDGSARRVGERIARPPLRYVVPVGERGCTVGVYVTNAALKRLVKDGYVVDQDH